MIRSSSRSRNAPRPCRRVSKIARPPPPMPSRRCCKEIEKNEQRKKEQAAKGLDGLTYFVLCKLTDDGIPNPEPVSKKVREAFAKFPNWQRSEAELREVRKQVTFAIFAEEDDMEKVTATVEALFTLLQKSFRP